MFLPLNPLIDYCVLNIIQMGMMKALDLKRHTLTRPEPFVSLHVFDSANNYRTVHRLVQVAVVVHAKACTNSL